MAGSEQTNASARADDWVLIVDDDTALATALVGMLGMHGWAARTASNVDEVIACVGSHAERPPALAICDIMIPGTDGIEIGRELRFLLPDLPLLFISGRITQEDGPPADLEGRDFLPKPFNHAQLSAAVEQALLTSVAS